MHRRLSPLLGAVAMLAGAASSAQSAVIDPPPPRDDKPERPQRVSYAAYGIPFPGLRHVSKQTLSGPPAPPTSNILDRFVRKMKREVRKDRMRLRKRRGWR